MSRRIRMSVATLAVLLSSALPACSAEIVTWYPAVAAERLSAWMIHAAEVQLSDAGAGGDFLVPIITAGFNLPESEASAEIGVRVPREGKYCVWARVRCPTGLPEGFAIVKDATPAIALSRLADPSADVRQWHWVGLAGEAAELALPAGQSILRVRAQDVRATVYAPNKWRQVEPAFAPRWSHLCVTDDPHYVPRDADVQPPLVKNAEPLPHVRPVALPPVKPGTWEATQKKPLPDWMRVPRWYTKDSWREELASRQPGDIARLVRQVAANGGNALRVSVYWGGETYYQSRVAPHAPGLKDLDYLREAVDEGRRTGVKIVAYLNPNTLYPTHPLYAECAVRDREGNPSTRGVYGGSIRVTPAVCVNHPRYRRFLREMLTEIFGDYKADGLYVDGLTPHVCFCEHCAAKYRALFGEEMPKEKLAQIRVDWAVWAEFGRDPQPVGDVENDPHARRLTELLYQSFGEITREVTAAVKAARPEAITAFHSHPKPNCAACYDGTLTEVYSPRPWVHIAWRSGELAAYSSGFHVPTMFNVYPHRHFSASEARYHALQGLANGAYPNFWSTPGMKPVFDFLCENAACFDFAHTTPVKFIALPRDIRTEPVQAATPLPAGVRYRSDRFLAPYVGVYSALTRAGLPVVTLHRPHFEEGLAGFQVLCLANVANMNDQQVAAVRRFVHDGGALIATHEASLRNEKGEARANFALADLFGVRYQRVLPATKRKIVFASDSSLGSAMASFSPLAAGEEPLVAVRLTTGQVVGSIDEPGNEASLPAVVVNRYGRGRVVYLPGRLDAAQCTELSPGGEQLFAAAVRWAGDDRMPITVQSPAMVGVSLFQQPDRWLVQLVNHNRDSRMEADASAPIERVTIRLRPPADHNVTRIRRLWNRSEIPLRRDGEWLSVELTGLGEYEALAVEFR